MSLDQSDARLREVDFRKGEFRELARGIVWKDRDSRKHGRNTNTGGAIAQALEAAYKLGLAHAIGGAQVAPKPRKTEAPDAPLPWNTIPPRSRSAFESIVQFKWLVLDTAASLQGLPFTNSVDCYWDLGEKADPNAIRYKYCRSYSASTLAPVVRLGLMRMADVEAGTLYVLTHKGEATWALALQEGHVQI